MKSDRADQAPKHVSADEQINLLKQLVTIQTRIVEVAKQNELAERECAMLREELAERVYQRRERQLSPRHTLRRWIERLTKTVSRRSNAKGH